MRLLTLLAQVRVPTGNVQDINEAARAINGILAPAIMISASALIILALQTKYSHLIDRLRVLNEERRRFSRPEAQVSAQRQANVIEQLEMILLRARMVRNSIMSLYIAIALFVFSSIVIGIRLTVNIPTNLGWAVLVFMFGMIAVFLGTVYALRDISIAYRVALLEVRGVKELDERK